MFKLSLYTIVVVCNLFFFVETLSIGKPLDGKEVHLVEAKIENTTVPPKTDNACTLDNLPFYVLNLDRRRGDKLWAMEAAIQRDVPWMCEKTCRVSAPDGRLWGLLKQPLNSHIIPAAHWQGIMGVGPVGTIRGGALTPGAIALMIGHARMWEHILQEKAPFAVIMEDDLSKFHPLTKEFLCKITHDTDMQKGWDFMLMQNAWRGILDAGPPSTIPILKWGHMHNTGMYIIKLDAVRKVLHSMFPITGHVQLDDPGSAFWATLRGGWTVPAIAEASHAITDVQQQGFARNTSSPTVCKIHDCKKLNPANMVVPELANPTKV